MSNNKIVVIDCQVAGVAGDMFVSALIDLGANPEIVIKAMMSVKEYLDCEEIEVNVLDVNRGGFLAKKVEVITKEKHEAKGIELINSTINCGESLTLSKKAKKFVSQTISTLVLTEAKVHGKSIEKVHLHEAGSADTPADIIGTAVALDDLNLFSANIYSTPVALGGGLFNFSHGTVSSPSPATLEILRSRSFPMIGGPIKAELTTPTGASILVNLAENINSFYPLVRPKKVGYGAGTKNFKKMPNLLRLVLGESIENRFLIDNVIILETNLDDVTGETIGHLMERLARENVLDVSIIPMFTKKNRPGQILKLITKGKDVDKFSRILMEETGTIGIRMYQCNRYILDREFMKIKIEVSNYEETIKVKISKDNSGQIIQIKPEYEDVKKVTEKTGKTLKEINDLCIRKVQDIFEK